MPEHPPLPTCNHRLKRIRCCRCQRSAANGYGVNPFTGQPMPWTLCPDCYEYLCAKEVRDRSLALQRLGLPRRIF